MLGLFLNSIHGGIWSYCFERLGHIPSKNDLQKFIKDDGKNCPKWCKHMYPHDKFQAKWIEEWKYDTIDTINNHSGYINKICYNICKGKFCCIGIKFKGAFKVIIKDTNYFYVWLPRQDELQQMLGNKYNSLNDINGLIRNFHNFYNFIRSWKGYTNQFKTKPASLEQLWLSYVMYCLYGLIWNGKKWRKG